MVPRNSVVVSKLVEIRGVQEMRLKTTAPTERFHFEVLRTAAAPRRKLQPAKLRDAPGGMCEGVGCARRQCRGHPATTHEV